MARAAQKTTAPVPMGFRFDPDKSIAENARIAWDTKRQVTRPQAEHNAKVALRHLFGRHLELDDVVFSYDEARSFERPLLELDDELVAWIAERGQFALVEWCSECGKAPDLRTFDSIAGLGQVLSDRDNDEPHVCKSCQILAAIREQKAA